jgi:hypothetical protein
MFVLQFVASLVVLVMEMDFAWLALEDIAYLMEFATLIHHAHQLQHAPIAHLVQVLILMFVSNVEQTA